MKLSESVRSIDELTIPTQRSALIVSEGLEAANDVGGRFTVERWEGGVRFQWNISDGHSLEDGEISSITVDSNGTIAVYYLDGDGFVRQTFTPPSAGLA